MDEDDFVDVPYQIADCLCCGKPIFNMAQFPPLQPFEAAILTKNKNGEVIVYGAYGCTTMDGEMGTIIDKDFLRKTEEALKTKQEVYICDECVYAYGKSLFDVEEMDGVLL